MINRKFVWVMGLELLILILAWLISKDVNHFKEAAYYFTAIGLVGVSSICLFFKPQ